MAPKTVINSRGLFEHACTQASTHASLHLAARGYTPRPTAAASPPLHAPPPPSPSPSPSPPKPKHPCNKSGETPGADSVASMTAPVWECACQRRRETERGEGGRAPVRVCLCLCACAYVEASHRSEFLFPASDCPSGNLPNVGVAALVSPTASSRNELARKLPITCASTAGLGMPPPQQRYPVPGGTAVAAATDMARRTRSLLLCSWATRPPPFVFPPSMPSCPYWHGAPADASWHERPRRCASGQACPSPTASTLSHTSSRPTAAGSSTCKAAQSPSRCSRARPGNSTRKREHAQA